MKPILYLFLISFTFLSAAHVDEQNLDKCHTAFDLALDSANAHHVDATVSIDKLMKFDKVTFSYDHCTAERGETINCSDFVVVIAPKKDPARLFSSKKGMLSEYYREVCKELSSGDRVIFERITYTKDEKKYSLRPVVFTIE